MIFMIVKCDSEKQRISNYQMEGTNHGRILLPSYPVLINFSVASEKTNYAELGITF